MIEHYLDGTQVFPATGEKIQITAENAILTKSGSYTLEVKYPLSIFENRRFFGDLDRTDITKAAKTWEVRIISNGKILMLGTATLIKATKDDVSVQYLAGNSQVNFWENAEKTYIDEYDYNSKEDGRDRVDVWAQDYSDKFLNGYGTPKRGRGYRTFESQGGKRIIFEDIWLFYKENPYKYVKPNNKIFMGVEKEFCFANVYDEDFGWKEDKQYKVIGGITIGNGVRYGREVFSMAEVSYGMTLHANCIMPHLLFIIKQIIEKRGYSIERNDIWKYGNTDDLYIASPRLSLKIADALPHWTVKEFFEQIENFFNCTLVFDEDKRTCSFIMNNTILNSSKVKIEKICDEHEESISNEESSEANIFSSNIKYKDIGKEDVVRCDDNTRKKYETIYGEGQENLRDKAKSVEKAVWKFYRDTQNKGLTFGWDGKNLQCIDYLCSQYRGSENDFELKIVPARTAIYYYNTGENNTNSGNTSFRYTVVPMAVLTMANSWKGHYKDTGDLIQEVQGLIQSEGEGTKEDFLPVFYYGGHRLSSGDGRGHYAVVLSGEGEEIEGMRPEVIGHAVIIGDQYTGKYWRQIFESNERKNQSLALVPGHTNIYHGEVFLGNPKINMEAQLQIKFESILPPNPRAIFIIHNKRYLCSKIEYEIDEKGIDPLMTGYFHEVIE